MKKISVILCVMICCAASLAWSEILVLYPNGTYGKKASLADANSAADVAGRTVVVTTPLSAVMSNISTSTGSSWRSDATLKVEKGGCVAPTTTFTGLPTAEVGWFCNAAGTPAAGDGTTDDTLAVQRAVDATTKLVVPMTDSGYRTTSAINITKPITIQGSGTFPYGTTGPYDNKGAGSWFYLDHTGTGFLISNNAGANFIASVRIQGVGTYRHHTTAIGAGWTPTVCGYDFVARNTDIFYDDVMMLNAYNGINHTHGDAGRVTINNVRGQWFGTGINIDKAMDLVRINNVHMWPFWSNDSSVTDYQQAHTNVISMNRCDNPMLSNIFSIYSNAGLSFYKNASGQASKIHANNIDMDFCKNAIYVDSTVDVITGQFSNLTSYGPATPDADSYNIHVVGSNTRFEFSELEGSNLSHGMATVGGTGNWIKTSGVRANNWDTLSGTHPLFDIADTNILRIPDVVTAEGSTGTTLFATTGVVTYPQFVTSGTATIASGTTSIVVNHGLPRIPTGKQIQIWMVSDVGSSKVCWVDETTITSTQFTIKTSVNPTTNIYINWRAALE